MSTQDAIYEKITSLNAREAELRAEIASIRRERERLKANTNMLYLNKRPEWLADLPKEFWYPAYQAGKLIAGTTPVADSAYSPPDLADWKSRAGLVDFLLNVGITVVLVIATWQMIFILL